MKKNYIWINFFIVTLFVFFGVNAEAQAFSLIEKYDKFNDVLYRKERKTYISEDTNSITIEEKGRKPVVYAKTSDRPTYTEGRRDSVVCFFHDVYGYEVAWHVVPIDEYADFYKRYMSIVFDTSVNLSKEIDKLLEDYHTYIVHRVITDYWGHYVTEYFWIKDELKKERLVYSR